MEPCIIDDERTTESPEPPNERNDVKDGTSRSQLFQRRIAHAITVTVANNRYISICTLEIRPAKDESATSIPTFHRRIFDAIKQIDISAAVITLDKVCITHSNNIITDNGYNKTLKECHICDITKRVYVSFQLESTHTVSQLKYGSTTTESKCIFDTLYEHSAFLKMNKFQSHTDVSIGLCLEIKLNLIVHKVLKEKIDEICTWLDLDDDDDDTKALTKEIISNHKLTQEIVIPVYDIHNKVFG